MSNSISKFRGVRRRRNQEGQSPLIAIALGMFVLLAISGIVFSMIGVDQNKKVLQGINSSYNAKVVSVSSPMFDKTTMVIERDGKQYRCDYPSLSTVESKMPLTCGEALTSVSAK